MRTNKSSSDFTLSILLLSAIPFGLVACQKSARPFDTQPVSTLASKLKVGMSEQQVLSIMGEPNQRSQTTDRQVLMYSTTDNILPNPDKMGLIRVRLKHGKVVEIYWQTNDGAKIIQ